MKYIVAIIQPDKLDDVLDSLEKSNIHFVTTSMVMGRGMQKGVAQVYRSHKEIGNLLRKVKIEVMVNDENERIVIDAIRKGGYTGQVGDGKIFVMEMKNCIRIRTGDEGTGAVGDLVVPK